MSDLFQNIREQDGETWMKPSGSNQARLTLVQITDVYTLDNFASLKTMLETVRASQKGGQVVSMLTGDFLAPYLLSTIDEGKGMMMAINETPIDILTFGNHEADIVHDEVCRHVKEFSKNGGTFINSNMQSHDSMQDSVPYQVIEITSPDGKQRRKIGLIAVLSNDPKLYSHFKEPAFGGATIDDPWETLAKYKTILEEEHGCDLVIPLEHMYVHENTKTTEQFDFPLILSGHDHHCIDERINGTRLVKPGMDGVYAAVIQIVWDDAESEPKINSTFVETNRFSPCPILKQKTDAAYDVLLPLQNSMLASVLPSFRPLTSKNARGSVCTMGKFVCSMLKEALSHDDEPDHQRIDAVILMGGNIRGNEDYAQDSFFSLETLEAEVKPDEVIGFVDMPGNVLAAGVKSTHSGDPRPGWFQYDDGIRQDEDGNVTHVGDKLLDPNKVYWVATKIKDLTNGQSPPLAVYYKAHPELMPSSNEQYVNIHSKLMEFFAKGMFHKLWDATGELIPDPEIIAEEANPPVAVERVEAKLRFSVLDRDKKGWLSVDDIHVALRDLLGLSVDDNYKILAEHVHICADSTGNGHVTVKDFEAFCTRMPEELQLSSKWQKAFPDPLPELSLELLQIHDNLNSHHFPADGPNLKRHDTEITALIEASESSGSPVEMDGIAMTYY